LSTDSYPHFGADSIVLPYLRATENRIFFSKNPARHPIHTIRQLRPLFEERTPNEPFAICLSRILDPNNRISIDSSRVSKNGRKPIRQKIYEILVGSVTELCYGTSLNYFPQNAAILDVGIGNGFMMKRYHELVKAKALKITGIDISAEALLLCARRVKAYGLEDHIELHQASIEDFHPEVLQPFDFIFF
jgi:2-polyprenyl-3-methyl-5-hydroxy-6-metoxy-1,4-benzoquinol methylase